VDLQGRTIWIVDAHGYGKRFIVRAEEKLTVFMELQRAIHEFAVSLNVVMTLHHSFEIARVLVSITAPA
jgi:hypothetical protein